MKQGIGNTGVPVAFPHSLGQKRTLDPSLIREVLYAYQANNDGAEAASATFSQPATVGEMFLPNNWGYTDFFCTSARARNDKAWRHAA